MTPTYSAELLTFSLSFLLWAGLCCSPSLHQLFGVPPSSFSNSSFLNMRELSQHQLRKYERGWNFLLVWHLLQREISAVPIKEDILINEGSTRTRGRPKLTWIEVLKKDVGWTEDMALNRAELGKIFNGELSLNNWNVMDMMIKD